MSIFNWKKRQSDEASAEAAHTADAAAAPSAPADLDAPAEPSANGAGVAPGQRGSLFERPEPLTPSAHGALKVIRDQRTFEFARNTPVAPIAMSEFPAAAVSYPIVFAGARKTPCVAMGFAGGENLFIDADGVIPQELYAPAFFRQHPFFLAVDAKTDRTLVLIDRAASCFTEGEGAPLFEGDKPSAFTEQAIAFLRQQQEQRRATEAAIEVMTSLDLFEPKDVKFTVAGEEGAPRTLLRYYGVSRLKVSALSAAQLKELDERNILPSIYAHLFSLMNWRRVLGRGLPRRAEPA